MAKTGSNALLAGIFGLAAGIGIGMLIAPAKGSKTRKRLKKRIMGFADFIEDGLSEKLNALKSALGGEEQSSDYVAEESEREEAR